MKNSKPSEALPGKPVKRKRHNDLGSQMSDLSIDGHLDSTMEPKHPPSHMVVARILTPWGVKGEVKATILTDFPNRFSLLETVYLGEELEPIQLEGCRLHNRYIVLKFRGLDQREAVERLRGKLVQIRDDEAIPLEEGTYYVHQIIGLDVWTEENEYLGIIDDVLFTGSNEVYLVKNKEDEILIPAIAQVVQEVDLEAGRLTVHLLEGLR